LTLGRRASTFLTFRPDWKEEAAMQWKTPVIIEIAVGCEINAYACAEVI
jgi:coenzyme PQQ precursor peptide PqqA